MVVKVPVRAKLDIFTYVTVRTPIQYFQQFLELLFEEAFIRNVRTIVPLA